jgi:hypothetical protein
MPLLLFLILPVNPPPNEVHRRTKSLCEDLTYHVCGARESLRGNFPQEIAMGDFDIRLIEQ